MSQLAGTYYDYVAVNEIRPVTGVNGTVSLPGNLTVTGTISGSGGTTGNILTNLIDTPDIGGTLNIAPTNAGVINIGVPNNVPIRVSGMNVVNTGPFAYPLIGSNPLTNSGVVLHRSASSTVTDPLFVFNAATALPGTYYILIEAAARDPATGDGAFVVTRYLIVVNGGIATTVLQSYLERAGTGTLAPATINILASGAGTGTVVLSDVDLTTTALWTASIKIVQSN